MYDLQKAAFDELMELEKLYEETKTRVTLSPAGRLKAVKRDFGMCYHRVESTGKITYLSRSEMPLIRALAQKAYDQKVLRCMKKRIKILKSLLSVCAKTDLSSLYQNMSAQRQVLVNPIRSRREQELADWIAMPPKSGTQPSFAPDAPMIMTERGERVRSKSEKILADYFHRHNIPYKYEEPLMLNGYGRVHPDFTFFSPVSGAEIYWEHMGRMDDPDYMQRAIKKIEAYADSGYDVGHRLLLTFETGPSGLNMTSVERLVQKHLLAPS